MKPERALDETRASSRDPSTRSEPRYDEFSEIGRGGMGVVYSARERESGERVAIKVLEWQGDARAAARFRREIEALSRINHLNVVRLRGSGWQGHRPYLVMDWIGGRNLEDVIFEARKHGALPEIPWVVDCLTKVASAVAEVHNQRLIHRDIKPANILIEDGTERPVLVDFGIVKRGAELGMTGSREVLGTPNYMSPEQLDPNSDFGDVSTKTDVWGLGATLYKALTGRGPFDAPTLAEIYPGILTKAPQSIRAQRPETPLWLEDVCLLCLEKSQDKRPKLSELIASLRSSGEAPTSPRRRGSIWKSGPWRKPVRKSSARRSSGLGAWGRKLLIASGVFVAAALALLIGLQLRETPVHWARLEDAARWAISSEEEQRAVAEAVGARLGEAFAFVDLPVYKGRLGMRVARFRHVKTGAVLHLIPGGAMTMGRDLSRTDRSRLEEAAAELEEARAEKRRLEALIADPEGWLIAEMERITLETNASGMRMAMGGRPEVVREMSFLTQDSTSEWRHVKDNLSLPQSTTRTSIIDLLTERKTLLVGLRNEYLKRKLAYHRAEAKRRPAIWRKGVEEQEAIIARLRWVTTVPARSPAHPVRLPPFLIGESELSWGAWTALPGHRGKRPEDKDEKPARGLSWDEAAAWLEAAGDGLRLPSETEWEYACRARSNSRYFWGDEISAGRCCYQANSGGRPWSARAEGKHFNAFGLVDTLGNVAEWCADDWLPDYSGKDDSAAPRRLADGVFEDQKSAGKAVRGGGYDSPKIMCRSRARWSGKRSQGQPGIGLRIARSFQIPKAGS